VDAKEHRRVELHTRWQWSRGVRSRDGIGGGGGGDGGGRGPLQGHHLTHDGDELGDARLRGQIRVDWFGLILSHTVGLVKTNAGGVRCGPSSWLVVRSKSDTLQYCETYGA